MIRFCRTACTGAERQATKNDGLSHFAHFGWSQTGPTIKLRKIEEVPLAQVISLTGKRR